MIAKGVIRERGTNRTGEEAHLAPSAVHQEVRLAGHHACPLKSLRHSPVLVKPQVFFACAGSFLLHFVWRRSVGACWAGLFSLFHNPWAELDSVILRKCHPSRYTSLNFNYLQIGGGRLGRGLLQNMLSMGWSVCVCISLNFPRNEVSFFSFSRSKIEGGERKEVAKSQVLGGSKITTAPSLIGPEPYHLNPSNILRISQDCHSGEPFLSKIRARWEQVGIVMGGEAGGTGQGQFSPHL